MRSGMLRDFLALAGRSILHRKRRSFLTVIGISIGITAVVGLISIGLSLEKTVTDQVGKLFGYNSFLLVGGDPFSRHGPSEEAFQLDLGLVRVVDGVVAVAAVRQENGFVTGLPDGTGKVLRGVLPVMGLSPELATDFRSFIGGLSLEKGGRFFVPGDAQQVILGNRIAKDLHATVGTAVLIEGADKKDHPFEVIGILDAAASSESGGGFSAGAMMPETDDTLYVPFDMMDTLFGKSKDVLLTFVKTAEGTDVQQVADRVETALEESGYKDASSVTSNDISKQIGSVMGAVRGFLAGIAGISLVVGAVGVMNTMYTSVLERTREIGVMKAVGATNGHVLLIFLAESGLLGFVGGAIGVVLGLGLSALAGILLPIFFKVPLATVISPGLIVGTLFFSFLLGAVAGLRPARRAAKLPPVDALRYE